MSATSILRSTSSFPLLIEIGVSGGGVLHMRGLVILVLGARSCDRTVLVWIL